MDVFRVYHNMDERDLYIDYLFNMEKNGIL